LRALLAPRTLPADSHSARAMGTVYQERRRPAGQPAGRKEVGVWASQAIGTPSSVRRLSPVRGRLLASAVRPAA